jgi:gephyrin
MARPVAGVRNKTLILTLPGSPKGAKENLEAVLKLLPHACIQAAGAESRPLHVGGVKKLEAEAGVQPIAVSKAEGMHYFDRRYLLTSIPSSREHQCGVCLGAETNS